MWLRDNRNRLAEGLITLFNQINAQYPKRDKGWDGSIGDAAHQSRTSDHNPWIRDGKFGVVSAMDVTHDPRGPDMVQFAEALRRNQDARISYIIWRGRICSSSVAPWQWRERHKGSDDHAHHCHISVRSNKSLYDSTVPWKLALPAPHPTPEPVKGRQMRIVATMWNDKLGAYGQINHAIPAVSLPAAFGAPLPLVRVFGPRGSAVGTVADKGPWYDGTVARPADRYWETDKRPRAETDPHTNRAGIDLNPVLAEMVGIDGKGLVDWEFVK